MKSVNRFIAEAHEQTIQNFVDFAAQELGLANTPNVRLVQVRENGMTTASYCPADKSIRVVSGNRATFDICRSIAHELVHQMQDECGDELDGDTGSPCEDEANAIAGRLVRLYGGSNEGFYEE